MVENKQKIIFTDKTDSAILDILKKNKLEETDDQVAKKLSAGKLPNDSALINISKKLATGELTDAAAASILEKDAAIPVRIAKKVVADIKAGVLPTFEKIAETEEDVLKRRAAIGVVEPTNENFPEAIPPETEEENKFEFEIEEPEETPPAEEKTPEPVAKPSTGLGSPAPVPKIPPIPPGMQPKNQPKKDNPYREPIE